MAAHTYQVLLHYLLIWKIHCFHKDILINLWQLHVLFQGAERTRTWECYFINGLFLWFNWACNHLSNGLKHSKSVVIVCYSERNLGHQQMATVRYIWINKKNVTHLDLTILLQSCRSIWYRLCIRYKCFHLKRSSVFQPSLWDLPCCPNLLNKWNHPFWNAPSTAMKTERVSILHTSAEQNSPISISFSWLQADRHNKITVCEG